MRDLEGKVVLITGAGRGIGRAAAIEFATWGSHVVLAGRQEASLVEVAAEVAALGREALVMPTDVTQEADVSALVRAAVCRFGRLDAAFNNAGTFGTFGKLENDTLENFEEVVGTNLRGVWLCTKWQIRQMLTQGGGAIVNCSSVSGVLGHLQSCVYSASKHGVIGLSKSAALQYARAHIRVNVVAPGSTDTEMLRAVYFTPESLRDRADMLPMGRLGRPQEVAQVAVWLCSDASSFVTGQVIGADGGVVAGRGEKRNAVHEHDR